MNSLPLRALMEKSGNTARFNDGRKADGVHEDAGELQVRVEHVQGFEKLLGGGSGHQVKSQRELENGTVGEKHAPWFMGLP